MRSVEDIVRAYPHCSILFSFLSHTDIADAAIKTLALRLTDKRNSPSVSLLSNSQEHDNRFITHSKNFAGVTAAFVMLVAVLVLTGICLTSW